MVIWSQFIQGVLRVAYHVQHDPIIKAHVKQPLKHQHTSVNNKSPCTNVGDAVGPAQFGDFSHLVQLLCNGRFCKRV